jgi:PAS domain S-box-containing protein
LRDSESKFRTLAESIATGAFICSDTRVLYVNQGLEKITGFSRDELVAMDIKGFIHPGFASLLEAHRHACQRDRSAPRRFEAAFLTSNGEERWIDATIAALDFGGVEAVLGTVTDATDRKQAEEQRGALKTILDSINEGVISVDRYSRVMKANRRALMMLNTEENSLIGRPVGEVLVVRADQGVEAFALEDFIKGSIAKKEIRLREDLWLGTGANGAIAISLTAAPEEGLGTETHGAVVVFADISHRREIDELRDSIISMVSHELRTPIHHVRSFASSLLQTDVQWSEEIKLDFIRSIDQESKRLSNLVSNILEMSRLGSGNKSLLNLSPICPRDLVNLSLEDASFRLQRPSPLSWQTLSG